MPESNNEIFEQELRSIIAEIAELSPAGITLDTDFVKDLGMDSMMALEIMAAIEKKYQIQIPEDKLMRLKNLRESIKLTKEYLT